MAYKQKKKSVGTKVMVWILILAMVFSFVGTLVYYIMAM